MKHVKVSLRSLLLWVAFAAVVAAALAKPSLLWSRLLFTLSLALIAWSAVGSFSTHGSRRTFWLGTATFALGYFIILTNLPLSNFGNHSTVFPRMLLTQQLLDIVARSLGHNVRSQFADFNLWEEAIFMSSDGMMAPTGGNGMGGMGGGMPGGAMGGGGFFDVNDTAVPEDAGAQAGGFAAPGMEMATGTVAPGGTSPAGTPAAAPTITRPYEAYNHFLISGHFAFLILIALGGGWLAQTFFKPDDATATS